MTAGKKVAAVVGWSLFGNTPTSTAPAQAPTSSVLPAAAITASTLPAAATKISTVAAVLKQKSRQEAFGTFSSVKKRDLTKVPRFLFSFIRPDEIVEKPSVPFMRTISENEIEEEIGKYKRLLRKDALKKHRHAQRRLKAGSKAKTTE